MAQIYIALVDTPGLFAVMIRRTIALPYVHVVLSMDSGMNEAYSFGRRNPAIPFFAGFEREEKSRILRAFPTARYRIFSLPCTEEQKGRIEKELREYYKKRFSYHYCLVGLPFLLVKRAFYQKNHYTCSSFVAMLLEENEVLFWRKHFSLVTPRDFYEHGEKFQTIIFEGDLRELVEDVVGEAVGEAVETRNFPA